PDLKKDEGAREFSTTRIKLPRRRMWSSSIAFRSMIATTPLSVRLRGPYSTPSHSGSYPQYASCYCGYVEQQTVPLLAAWKIIGAAHLTLPGTNKSSQRLRPTHVTAPSLFAVLTMNERKVGMRIAMTRLSSSDLEKQFYFHESQGLLPFVIEWSLS
ncbi:hypothetical protein Moror_8647, partial [Moniliophthora roreri MCA 2997]